jgi:acetyl-CoA C-acetyltransferase
MRVASKLPKSALKACRHASTSATSRKVYIVGQGIVPVSRKQAFPIGKMGAQAINAAIQDAGIESRAVGAVYAGNMLAGMLSNQQHIATLLASEAGLAGVEAASVEACCGSGGAALRWGYMSLLSGIHDTVVVAGVEAMTHVDTESATKGLATASDWDSEGGKGETFVSLNGILMDMYIKKYKVDREIFFPFSATAHQNAMTSPHAMLKKAVSAEAYRDSKVLPCLENASISRAPGIDQITEHTLCQLRKLSSPSS